MMDVLAGIHAIGFFGTWIALYLRAEFPPRHWLYHGRQPSRWKAVTSIDGREPRRIIRVDRST